MNVFYLESEKLLGLQSKVDPKLLWILSPGTLPTRFSWCKS